MLPIRERRYLSCCPWRGQGLRWGNTEDGGYVASIAWYAGVGGNRRLRDLATSGWEKRKGKRKRKMWVKKIFAGIK